MVRIRVVNNRENFASKVVIYCENRHPLCFALITDLTSFIQIADILKIDMSGEIAHTEFIELKEGVMNTKVLEFLDMFYRIDGCPRAAWFFAQEEGMDAFKQAQRVMGQQIRGNQAMQIIKTGKGLDPFTKSPVLIPDEVIEEEDYDDVMRELIKTCRKQGYAISLIDDSLWIGVFDAQRFPEPRTGFAHSIYHVTKPDRACLLFGSEHDIQNELSEISKSLYPITDLRQGLETSLSVPLFLRGIEKEAIFDIIFGRIVVLSYLDFEKLFERVRSKGIVGRWSTTKDTKFKPEGYFKHLGKMPIFERGGRQVAIGDGLIVKMQIDGITVDSIVNQIDAFLRLAEPD